MSLLAGLRVVQYGPGLAAAVCGRLFADTGATVTCSDPGTDDRFEVFLNRGKSQGTLADADIILCEGGPHTLAATGRDTQSLRRQNTTAAIVLISPFGQTGPRADEPATDLTLFFASGISRLLTGQILDLSEPPIRAAGEQSAFLGGVAAACAVMHAALHAAPGAVLDVSMQEALATLAMTELARAGLTGKSWDRKRLGDGNGSTVCILPARDGYVAISPREEHQWASWLETIGSPAWGIDPRFRQKADRAANWDACHALLSEWSRQHDKQWIADKAQEAHVPSFPLREPHEQFASPQLRHRGFYQPMDGSQLQAMDAPLGLSFATGNISGLPSRPLPLSGVRVLDFSWVIAGPTATRYLAVMGAEVIKVEAPGRGDPGRASELHTVLGQAKRGIVLDLKKPEAVQIARDLAAKCDVLLENFATGVMDRLGLGADALRAVNPKLIYISASGLGRTGPEARGVAYGTLLQCYAGFAGLNRHPDNPPRVGFAWLDPMCGLMLAFSAAAALWRRQRDGQVARIDFSMVEAMLWTMAKPMLAAQSGNLPRPLGNESDRYSPHNVYRCDGPDDWVSIVAQDDAAWDALCGIVPELAGMAQQTVEQRRANRTAIDAALARWAAPQSAEAAAAKLSGHGIASAALARSSDLVSSPHLRARGFWDTHQDGVLPGLPWRASFGRATGTAPGLGADTEAVMRDILGLSSDTIAACRQSGVFG